MFLVAVGVLAALGAAAGDPRGEPYLPPPPDNATDAAAAATPATPATSDDADLLLNRFGGGDGGIHFAADHDADDNTQAAYEQRVGRAVTRGVTSLALRLDAALSGLASARAAPGAPAPYDNVVFSPISVASAMALVLLGSAGTTYDEVSGLLGLAPGDSGGGGGTAVHQHFGRLLDALTSRASNVDAATEAVAAQAVFPANDLRLRPRYRQVVEQAYHADVVPLDYVGRSLEAQQAVNAWVENRTRGHIDALLEQPPPPSTRVMLASALYFNGRWEYPFRAEATQKRPFYVEGTAEGETLEVDMMAGNADVPYINSSALGCQAVALPYKGGDVSFWIVLPYARGAAELKAFQAALTADALEGLFTNATVQDSIIVLVPRMKLNFLAYLRRPLEQMGVHTLFDPTAADLSQLAQPIALPAASAAAPSLARSNNMLFRERRQAPLAVQERVFVNEVVHKVEVEVTETGTVASAATLVSITRGPHPVLRADRPFLFFIRHQPTGALLFAGSVVRPTPAP